MTIVLALHFWLTQVCLTSHTIPVNNISLQMQFMFSAIKLLVHNKSESLVT
jgi:hypothetical protein